MPNHTPNTSARTYQTVGLVEAATVPVTIAVEEDELDPDTLEHEGRDAAIREAAMRTFLGLLEEGYVEVTTSLVGPA